MIIVNTHSLNRCYLSGDVSALLIIGPANEVRQTSDHTGALTRRRRTPFVRIVGCMYTCNDRRRSIATGVLTKRLLNRLPRCVRGKSNELLFRLVGDFVGLLSSQ